MPDQVGRDAVVALPDDDPRIPVDPWGQEQTGLEGLGRQWPQQVPLEREVLGDAQRTVGDPAGVISQVVGLQQLVELGHRLDLRDRDQVVAAEPAALTFDTALLVRALNTGVAVEGVEPVFTEPGAGPWCSSFGELLDTGSSGPDRQDLSGGDGVVDGQVDGQRRGVNQFAAQPLVEDVIDAV